MKHLSVFVICLVTAALLSACHKKPEGALVTVGDETITEADLDLLGKVNPRLQRRLASEPGRKQVLDNYVEQELLSQEAKKRGLDRDETVKAKIDLYDKVILAQSLLEEALDKAAKEYYDNNGPEFEKIKIAHIYVPFKSGEKDPALSPEVKVTRTADEAKKRIDEAKAKLKNEDFAAVASEYSEDVRTKDNGGDLGWVGENDVRLSRWGWAPIVKDAMSMQKGAVSEPIETASGYHLVLLEEPVKREDFDQAQARIRFMIQQQVKTDLVDSLRKKYAVKYVQPEGASSEAAPQAGTLPAEPEKQAKPVEPEKSAKPAEGTTQAK